MARDAEGVADVVCTDGVVAVTQLPDAGDPLDTSSSVETVDDAMSSDATETRVPGCGASRTARCR